MVKWNAMDYTIYDGYLLWATSLCVWDMFGYKDIARQGGYESGESVLIYLKWTYMEMALCASVMGLLTFLWTKTWWKYKIRSDVIILLLSSSTLLLNSTYHLVHLNIRVLSKCVWTPPPPDTLPQSSGGVPLLGWVIYNLQSCCI